MWARLSAAALVVQAHLMSVVQLPLTTLKEGPHLSGLARTGCSSHLTLYFSPNMTAALLPICSVLEPRHLVRQFEVEEMPADKHLLLEEDEVDEDPIPQTGGDEARPIWWTIYGAMIAMVGLIVSPLLLALGRVPRTLLDFLLRATVLLFIASLVANYSGFSMGLDLEQTRLISTVALIVMGSMSGLHMVCCILLPLCLLAWPTGLTMAVVGVHLAQQPMAPALLAAAIFAWLTFVGFYTRHGSRKFEKSVDSRGRSKEREHSGNAKKTRGATPTPPPRVDSARAGGA